ncbi:30S ribosomal protein S13 [Candidatus Gottesmanbacteria bacterium CG11_big_fil_rev_8_21_14_0_20_37_11]|uniref:Small ribosomal subunit protein uS13 n=3 Tax=Candidatus Gottesmaniibacteriota TaxID=1752720 RepID=A0A2M7RS25_9BACT|nr:MAG: 30S ribosomal protein S13 [Candidatus Gottesmanbacteria bacterium CG1_02_37_22]PIP32634.1 MAG: 30S ribosomal protein S13 [Candidatus Gottesmanbacteria bacterium CG23_combo_of_CG06-09_8_20_14_all_37_19]PIR08510.1 MAG: 30S ribosomal protein S13 [Candidatus Gottesmanbacteria bacterium CG11_big_fil_rev_8_21_14_0_20_37_11]PIZ03066.1 MAG: 30S ribosomal protein S13 [Candidatus Gottesmanbacteria bacterium CG_4_10_14_0_8_um_filter_37_24]
MARIAGIDLPDLKRIDIALTSIYGIGRSNVVSLLKTAAVEGAKRVKDLSEEDVNRIQKTIDKEFKVEGDLKSEISDNIKRLKEIGSYRGLRHIKNLPSRGQRTRSNARTKRGKRQTVGALRKETRAKLTQTQPTKE